MSADFVDEVAVPLPDPGARPAWRRVSTRGPRLERQLAVDNEGPAPAGASEEPLASPFLATPWHSAVAMSPQISDILEQWVQGAVPNPTDDPAAAADENLYPTEELDTEFKRKYPPDRFGEEMADNARVWKVYRNEATIRDEAMLDGWNKTLDILLIFAGLFSAVATAFIIESYKLLQPDFAEYSARALYVLASSQIASNTSSHDIAFPPPSRDVSSTSLWINGLWLTSLVLSLAVALLCILVKQWLTQYKDKTTLESSSFRYWARRRSLYYDGLSKWHLPALMSTLPLLLHAALFLFLGGLVLLISGLNSGIGAVLLAITVILATFYLVCLVLPTFQVDCPTSTPLLDQLRRLTHATSNTGEAAFTQLLRLLLTSSTRNWRIYQGGTALILRTWRGVIKTARLALMRRHEALIQRYKRLRRLLWDLKQPDWSLPTSPVWRSVNLEEYEIARRVIRGLDADPLCWMLRECSAPELLVVACQAPAALHPGSAAVERLRRDGAFARGIERSAAAYASGYTGPPSANPALQADLARYARAFLCVKSRSDLYPWPGASEQSGLSLRLLRPLWPAVNDAKLKAVLDGVRNPETCASSGGPCFGPVPTSLALQILSLKGVYSRDIYLTLIAGLDVSTLDPVDIIGIAHRLHGAIPNLDQLGFSARAGRRLALGPNPAEPNNHDCILPCAINSICGAVYLSMIRDGLNWDRAASIHVVVHLLDHQLNRVLWWRSARPSFSDVSNIWKLAGSDKFFSGEWPTPALQKFGDFLCSLVTPGMAAVGQPSVHIGYFLHAMRRLLHVAHSSSVHPVQCQGLITSICNAIIVAMFPADSGYGAFDALNTLLVPRIPPPQRDPIPPDYNDGPIPLPRLDSHRISPSTANPIFFRDVHDVSTMRVDGPLALLLRLDSDDVPSIWKMLTDNWYPWWNGPASAIHLAGILAMHLCFYTGKNVPGIEILAAEFFACESVGVLLADPSLHDEYDIRHLTGMLRHCLPLRPEWWAEVKTRVQGLQHDDPRVSWRLAEVVKITDGWLNGLRERDLECGLCGFALVDTSRRSSEEPNQASHSAETRTDRRAGGRVREQDEARVISIE